MINGVCYHSGDTSGGQPARQGPPIRYVTCGPGELLRAPGAQVVDKRCASPVACLRTDPVTHRLRQLDEIAQLQKTRKKNSAWKLVEVYCPGLPVPAPDVAAIRAQALRLLPHVAPRSAGNRSLVNIETVLWAGTDPNRALATVTVLGRQVALRIGFDHADWDFGDGQTATTTSPQHAYDLHGDPCDTVQCPDYWGHVYTDNGPRTVTLTVAWTAQFSLDGARTWIDIPGGTLTGPASTHHLTVLQARGVLVGNPDGS